ncbi:hypothetical protein JST97_26130 [bacterium]|nr:hypothetical protein [bacterium]
MQFRLPIGNRAIVGDLTLRSNGKVDRAEGKVPPHGIKRMDDPRLEEFVRTRDTAALGQGWKGYGEPEYGTGRIIAGANAIPMTDDSYSGQFLILDPRAHTLTLQTQGLQQECFNHWISAKYDVQSGAIKADTIHEWVSH